MRTPPMPVPTIQLQPESTITEERTYSVITPLFGGGVEPGKADPITIVRASEIRGHLRFWWRATRGGQFGDDLMKMREAEEALWGGPARYDEQGKPVAGQSLVQVTVELVEQGWPMIPEHAKQTTLYGKDQKQILKENLYTPELARCLGGKSFFYHQKSNSYRPFTVGDPDSKDGYLAFPLRGDEQQPAGLVYEGVQFIVSISYPVGETAKAKAVQHLFPDLIAADKDITHEVASAIWAWETFGGLGARTRRGFGALALHSWEKNGVVQTVQRPANTQSAKDWLQTMLKQYAVAQAAPAEVPHLLPLLQFKVSGKARSGKNVWRELGGQLKAFRQKRRHGYAPPGRIPSSYGRSKWPEPDAVRDLARTAYEERSNPQHNHKTPIYNPIITAFPRAAFGLPISFEFHRDHTNSTKARELDPVGKNTLEGDKLEHERLSSPLILRPLQCADGSFVGLAAILEGTHVPPMHIAVKRRGKEHIQKGLTAALSQSDAQSIGTAASIPLLQKASTGITSRDILLAFLESMKEI